MTSPALIQWEISEANQRVERVLVSITLFFIQTRTKGTDVAINKIGVLVVIIYLTSQYTKVFLYFTVLDFCHNQFEDVVAL